MRRTISILFALTLVLSFSLVATTPVAAETFNVPSATYPTIQSAIDAANPAGGDTIIVAAGTYTAIDRALAIIDRPLTLVGAGQADDSTGTILDGGTYGHGQDNTGLGIAWPRAIVVQSDDVTIRNMRIREYQGDQISVGGYAIVARAIASWGVTEPTLDNIVIEDITFEDCYYGVRGQKVTSMLIQRTTFGQTDGATDYAHYVNDSQDTVIRANTVDKGSIWVTAATNALIGGATPADGNMVTDATYNGIWLGQQFASGTSSGGTIQHNTVNGAFEGGIVVWNWQAQASAGVRILDNVVSGALGNYDSHGGISIWSVDNTPLEIRRNRSTGNTVAGLSLRSSSFVQADVSNNTLEGNSGYGVYIDNASNVAITCNTIRSNNIGIWRSASGAGVNNRANLNSITGNTVFGVQNMHASAFNATLNWWGHDSGPDGIGDKVSGSVLYDPWIKKAVATTATGTGPVLFSPSVGNILDLTPVAAPSLPSVTFPHGMFSFQICCLTPGQTVDLTVTLPSNVPVGTVWWKYDNGRWYSLPNLDDNGDNKMRIRLTDGGVGDSDGVADGFITDPGGPGNPMTVGWDGSPVSRAGVLAPWIALLAAIVAGAGLSVWKRRRVEI